MIRFPSCALLVLTLSCGGQTADPDGATTSQDSGDGKGSDRPDSGDGDGDGEGGAGTDNHGGSSGTNDVKGSDGDAFTPAPWCPAAEAPGTLLRTRTAKGTGACAGKTLEQVLEQATEDHPDLVVPPEREGDGAVVGDDVHGLTIFQTPDGFAFVFSTGTGDCESGCIEHAYSYWETDEDCSVEEVGHYELGPGNGCYEAEGEALWGVPAVNGSLPRCGESVDYRALEGGYEATFTGQYQPCTAKTSAEPARQIEGKLTLSVQVTSSDPAGGTVKIVSDDIEEPWLLDRPLDFSFSGYWAQGSIESDNLPSDCFEQYSGSFGFDLRACSASQLRLEFAHELDCETESDDYCKGFLSLEIDTNPVVR